MEDMDNTPVASSQTDTCDSEVGGRKLTNDVNTIISADSWEAKARLTPLADAITGAQVVGPTTEAPGGGVALKVATTLLQPICLGESPVMLPIHLQMSGAAVPHVGQMGAAPYFMTSQGPVSLPLVLEQQLFQHLIPQAAPCSALPLQNNILCQNASLTFGSPPSVEQKPGPAQQDPGLLALLQNPAFAAILQDLFPIPGNSSSCQSPGSIPTDPFASAFLPPPPPLAHPYSSPLAGLVPPATLLVPYPVVVPLPVPLPIPLPIPIPVPQTPEDSKGNLPKATVSKSTQTYSTSSPPSPSAGFATHGSSLSSLSPVEGEVLDLSMKACPIIEPKQEAPPSPQENVLDLSVASARRMCGQSCGDNAAPGVERERKCPPGQKGSGSSLSLGLLRPVECTQRLDSKLLSGLASLEFSRQHKWVVDSSSSGGASALGRETSSLSGTGNLEIVSTSQTAKVIVSVKDAIPAILCGKISGLSGVSTKNFSIKRDAAQGASLQHLYGASSRDQGEQQCDPNDPLKKVPKNRAIKLKKVSSQEIHILPIKKQRLAAFLPRK